MPDPGSKAEFRDSIVNQVEAIILSCEERRAPLELDPARGDLFDLFVAADRAGALAEESEIDLTADALCQILASRWGLKSAAEESVVRQQALPPEHVSKMRGLWSMMRMWMEWTYAWHRWPEFHQRSAAGPNESAAGAKVPDCEG